MPAKTDKWGQTQQAAEAALHQESHSTPHGVLLIRGVWLATYMNAPDAYAKARGAWRLTPSYCAVGKGLKLIYGIGNRKGTVDAALAQGT